MHSEEAGLAEYDAPEWCRGLTFIPKYRISLARPETPIHRWRCPRLPENIDLFIKRDDLTGCAMTGNKVRKLEFIMADAMARGVRHVVAWGGVQSNFCRTLAVAAKQLGITPHIIVLHGDENDRSANVPLTGNVLLEAMLGAELYHAPDSLTVNERNDWRDALADRIAEKTGEKALAINVGGCNLLGLFGYIDAFNELLEQGVAEKFDDIVVAFGAGGTALGLAIGNYLSKSKLRIHAVITDPKFHDQMQHYLDDLGLKVQMEEILDLIHGYLGLGYGLSSKEEREFLLEISRQTGIVVDPIYTVKAVLGLVTECRLRPNRFKGNRVLFIHTGGMFCNLNNGSISDMAARPYSFLQP